ILHDARLRLGSHAVLVAISSVHCQPPGGKCQFGSDRAARRQMPKPGELPFGEVAAARLNTPKRVLPTSSAIQIIEHLLVTQRLPCLAAERALQSSQRAY